MHTNTEDRPARELDWLSKLEKVNARENRNRQQQIKQDLQRHLEKKLHPYTNPNWRSHLAESSLWQIHDPRLARYEFIRCVFYAGDRIWMGDVYHSGKPKHAANFKPVYDWLEMPNLPCPNRAPIRCEWA